MPEITGGSESLAITVVICTRDRPKALERALGSITECEKPPVSWELVIVDNGSTDLPADVVTRYAHALPIRVVREKRPGLSIARNTAVGATGSTYIIWTDDDVVVGRRWLRSYWEAFARFPAASFFGGGILPLFEPAAAAWLERGMPRIAGAFAFREAPRDWCVINRGIRELPFGANMAFRAADLRRFPFDPLLGRGSGRIPLGEETWAMRRMLDAGHHGAWVPSAEVQHVIGQDRQTTRYLWDYFRGVGISKASTSGALASGSLQSAKRWMRIARKIARYVRDRAVADPETWVASLTTAAIAIGEAEFISAESRRELDAVPVGETIPHYDGEAEARL